MATTQFEAKVRRDNRTVVIDLVGEINTFAEDALNSAYAEAASGDPKIILLNFSSVDYINSTGIALIVGLLAQARKSGRRLLVYGLTEHYRELFEITRLSDFMDILPDEETAITKALQPDA